MNNSTSVDELINSAFTNTTVICFNNNYYIVEAHPKHNKLRIKSSSQLIYDNLEAFSSGTNEGFITLGVYKTLGAAKEAIKSIRKWIRNKDGKSMIE